MLTKTERITILTSYETDKKTKEIWKIQLFTFVYLSSFRFNQAINNFIIPNSSIA
jgi:hypothetical protein